MNGIYVIIVFLCLQEFTDASFFRIPKRYFRKNRQETKQAKNAPLKVQPRNIPINKPVTEQPIQIQPEIFTNTESNEALTENIISNDVIPIIKTYQPLLKYELPKMVTLPILTILPIVASLPVVNVAPKLPEKLQEALPELKVQDVTSVPVEDEFVDDDDEIDEVIEESVTMNLQQVKYEVVKRDQKKSPILHKVHRIEEFKRNILIDRREDLRNGRVGEKEGHMDLKEYLERIAMRAELLRN